MNEVTNYTANLPDTLEDLSKFVLVNEERIQALRAQIRAIKKVSLAKEVYEQKLAEAQEIGQITVEAAQKMGELLLQIQKRSGASNFSRDNEKLKSKSEITSEMGMTKDQVSQYQQMAQNPEAVQAAIQKAIENGDVVSRNQVMKEIRAFKAEITERDNKIDELIDELENRKPEVVVKEVVPEDYEKLKRENIAYRSDNRSLMNYKQKSFDEVRELKERIRDLESRSDIGELQNKVKAEAGYFAIRTYNYIQQNGGIVWIFEQIDKLSDKERKDFVNAIYSADAFIRQMIENLGGYGVE